MITNKHTDTHCITSGNKLFYAAVTGRDHSQIVTMGRIGSQHTIRVQSSNSKTGCCLKFFVTILAITVIVLVGVIIWLIYRAPTASDGSAYLFQSGPSTASGGFIEDAVCKLPKDVGPCRGALLRYYFNYETKRCDEFIYGGCKGNANNFQTILECQELCMKPATKIAKTDVCKLPQDVGPCKAMIPRFAYDDNLKACVPFTYGGCQGNGNNFETKEQCEAQCMAFDSYILSLSAFRTFILYFSALTDNACKQPIKVGPCLALIPRYGFDPTVGKCVQFMYGGCEQNENNFETLEACQEICQAAKAEETDVCKLPQDVGPCKARIQRITYDDTIKACVPFTYGGCQGNGNNFETKEECEKKCVATAAKAEETDVCKLPQDVGPCRAMFPRFAYDDTMKACVPFIYGGCQGNGNNFETKEECEKKCVAKASTTEETDVCKLPQYVGPCRARIQRFAYDANLKACVPFTYGGCQGNGNNFETKEQCEAKCMGSLPCEFFGPTVTFDDVDDPCKQPIEVGPCFALIPRYAFNQRAAKCISFNYGGCQGNNNNFETLEAYQQTCSILKISCISKAVPAKQNVQGKGLPERCTLPLSKGPCNMHWRRYAYSFQDNTCRLFIYGGCQGNENNFATREECERECVRSSPYHFLLISN
ncbi:unnamed protein product [Schistocephalus solidus]|uniref:Papilin n=1 Tax=Schistocephalus solidus TaxID=70667 RepID=A0A183SMA9_SCHSO|nr:unnamed protein product [Schistocephalus solidus]